MLNDNPAALRYFLQDDLYLLGSERDLIAAAPEQPAIETPEPVFNYLGGNKKRMLVLVSYAAHEHMDPVHLKALESTLNRKELAVEDVAILNLMKHAEISVEQLFAYFNPEKLVILGKDSLPAAINAPLNTTTKTADVLCLYSYSFDEMLADREKAKAFWEQMKAF